MYKGCEHEVPGCNVFISNTESGTEMPERLDAVQRDLDRPVEWVLGNLMRFKRGKVQGPLLLQEIPARGRGVQPDDL